MNDKIRLAACTLIYYIILVFLTRGKHASTIKIRPESCTNAMGEKGICMFVWQCIKQDGVQLGPCVDRFLVGSCCSLPKEEDNFVPGSFDGSLHKNTSTELPFSPPKQQQVTNKKPTISSTEPSVHTLRPALMTTRPLLLGIETISVSNSFPYEGPYPAELTTVPMMLPSTEILPSNNDFDCGITGLFPKSKVVGGTHSSFGEWPWQISVRRTSFFGFASTHRCGGAILSDSWVVTAAHCVDDLLKSQIRVRVGEYDFSTVQEPAPFQERGVEKKVVHPRYNFFTYEYDLALVKLDAPLKIQNHVRPICLPERDNSFVGINATVTGWGRLSEGGTLPTKLQQVQVPIISNERCQKMFQTAGRNENIPEIFLCAGYEAGGRDSCQGDSGGPLQAKGKDGRWFLAGIISWGIGCAEPNMPGVCTRITKFVSWIRQTVG